METGKPEKILRKLSKFLLEINQEKELPEPLVSNDLPPPPEGRAA